MKKLINSEVIFNEAEHTYILNDKSLLGITTMIREQIFPDKYQGVPMKLMEAAADRGKKIHEQLHTEDVFGGNSYGYGDLKKEHNIEVIDNEYLVTDYDYFATAIDKVALVDGKLSLIDVKTTYNLDEKYLSWQLSICKHFFELVNPAEKVEKLYAIWVKDDKANLHEIKEIDVEIVKELLQKTKDGEQFENPFVLTEPDKQALELIQNITHLENEIKALNAVKDNLKEQIEKAFSKHNVDKWETDSFVISKRKAYEREGADVQKLKDDGIFEQYKKITKVKESITIKLK